MARSDRESNFSGGVAEEDVKKGKSKRRSSKKRLKEKSRHKTATGEVPVASPGEGSSSTTAPGGSRSPARERSASPAGSRREASPEAALPPPRFSRRRTCGEVWRCKKGKRTDIKPSEWDKYRYVKKEEVLARPIQYDQQTVPIWRVKAEDCTPEWFFKNVSSQHRPVIIEGGCAHWPAMQRWGVEALEERFKNVEFKVAKDDKGKKLRMKFKYYADYLRHQQDDSPLYLFETNVDDNAMIRPIVKDYDIPDVFPHDWFGLVNHDSRPPYRWFCIGPKRSGTTVHIDPLGTAAWNAVTHGTKRWVLFEPKESKRVVTGKDVRRKGEDDEAIMYFDFLLPRIKRRHPDLKVYEGLQNPGDIIFVPGDWWHGVLNLEDCIAVTQNYCGADNFDHVWCRTRREREKVAYLWLRNMRKFAPDLHERALALNRKDGFRMRHERPVGQRLSDASSSSSESSTDSTSDDAADVDPRGLQGAVGEGAPLGPRAFRRQGGRGQPERAVTPDRGAELGRPSKRQRR